MQSIQKRMNACLRFKHKSSVFLNSILGIYFCACSQRAPPQPPYTDGVAEIEFIQTCARVYDYDSMQSDLRDRGWQPKIVEQGSSVEFFINGLGYTELQFPLGGNASYGRTLPLNNIISFAYAKEIEGRSFDLIVTRDVRSGLSKLNSCFMFNYETGHDLVKPDPANTFQDWLSFAPFEEVIDEKVKAKYWVIDDFDVAMTGGVRHVVAFSVMDDQEVVESTGYSGRSWQIFGYQVPGLENLSDGD